MKAPPILAVLYLSLYGLIFAEPPDNRFKGIEVGDELPSGEPDKFLSEPELLKKIATFHNSGLDRAISQCRGIALSWQRRVALRDADYFLCVFNETVRLEPGDNSRILILFTPEYQLKTWTRVFCEPSFVAAVTQYERDGPRTYFVTINQSGRAFGELFFESYTLDPGKIQRVGETFHYERLPAR